jgi:hypothetical protein
LQEYYTIEEAFLLWECIAVPAHNEYTALKKAQNEANRK